MLRSSEFFTLLLFTLAYISGVQSRLLDPQRPSQKFISMVTDTPVTCSDMEGVGNAPAGGESDGCPADIIVEPSSDVSPSLTSDFMTLSGKETPDLSTNPGSSSPSGCFPRGMPRGPSQNLKFGSASAAAPSSHPPILAPSPGPSPSYPDDITVLEFVGFILLIVFGLLFVCIILICAWASGESSSSFTGPFGPFGPFGTF